MLGKSGGDLDLGEILQRDFHVAAFELAIDNLIDVGLGVVHVHGFAQKSEDAAAFGGDDGDADIDVGQQTKIVVVDRACDLAHVARAAKFDGGRNGADGSIPDASGQCVPGNFDSLSSGETADFGLVDERTEASSTDRRPAAAGLRFARRRLA